MEHLKIKIIEIIQILKTEASPSRAIFAQIIFELEGKTQGTEMQLKLLVGLKLYSNLKWEVDFKDLLKSIAQGILS